MWQRARQAELNHRYMLFYLIISALAFLVLVWHSRAVGLSLGLPIAYLFSLLLQHLPGGLAHLVGGRFFDDSSATEIGLRLTTIGTLCFVVGVVLAQRIKRKPLVHDDPRWVQRLSTRRFALFCLYCGWLVAMVASILSKIPSIGSAIGQAGSTWILGVLIGMLAAVRKQDLRLILLWLGALSIYPLIVLIGGGFLSFGTTSVFVVMAALCVMVRSQVRAYVGVVLFSLLCFLAFMSYFQNRNAIRKATWGGESLQERMLQSSKIITEIAWFNPSNPGQLDALDQRLNQNLFVGEAVKKLAARRVDFLHGRSVWEGIQALVPRILWPGKPIFAGTSAFIRKFTYVDVNENTSFGVGQVMEFFINFAQTGVVVGFLVFGFAYGWVDRMAATALRSHNYGQAIIWFLPAIGMLAPLASVAEVMGSIAAALVGAYAWRYAWRIKEARNRTAVRPRRHKAARADTVGRDRPAVDFEF